ncbi:MAG: response regulator [Verrucomicrobiota bacterium]|nr:response regulator [Verrucomicrobiota bacterium]
MKKSKWILLVDDDPPTAELTTLALAPEELACDVIVARDGLEALDCLYRRGEFQGRDRSQPAFVLLDLKMPKMDGLEVLQQIKSDARFKNIPVVMFTSSSEPTDVSRSYELGANAYVVKPADFPKFNETLKRVGCFWGALNVLPPQAMFAETETRDRPRLAAAI